MARNPAILAAGVIAGLLLTVAAPSAQAVADRATTPEPDPTNQTADAAAPAAPEPPSAATKIDAARVLENSASVLRAFPALSPETPAALLEGTAAVLAAMGLAG